MHASVGDIALYQVLLHSILFSEYKKTVIILTINDKA